jgi:hypothetical protein
MNNDNNTLKRRPPEPYEPPEALRLHSRDFSYGLDCPTNGNSVSKYRVNEHWGNCVTGKSAREGCNAGIGVGGCGHGSRP